MLSLPPDQLQIDKFVQFQLNQSGFFDAYNANCKAHMDCVCRRLVCDQRCDNKCKSNLKSAANNRKELNPASKEFLVEDVERSCWKKVSERVPSVHSLSGSLIWASA